MTMKAQILRDSLGNIIVQMQGDLDYATSKPLRDKLQVIVDAHPESHVQIDMAGMSFVGSSGISHFVDTLKLLYIKREEKIELNNVDQDFKKVFELYGLTSAMVIINNFDLHTEETDSLNKVYGNRKHTFEN